MTAKKEYYKQNEKKIITSLAKRHMVGYYCESKEEALKKALEIMNKGATISWGGSQTLREIGILKELKNHNYILLDRETAKSQEELEKIYHQSFSADYYLMSTNAITINGKLINMDGRGNRIAALIYGPKNVIVFAGMNKVVPNVEAGIERIKALAAPMNAIRLQTKTPCNISGYCQDCNSTNSICSNLLITRLSKTPNRIKVILIGEELGY